MRPGPITKLNTPAGIPASAIIFVNSQAQAGACSAGFITTVLPYARAGAIFHAGIAIGKFHGVIRPTTPTASRVISTFIPGRTAPRRKFFARYAQGFGGKEFEKCELLV